MDELEEISKEVRVIIEIMFVQKEQEQLRKQKEDKEDVSMMEVLIKCKFGVDFVQD